LRLAVAFAMHLKKYLLLYTILSIILAVIVGNAYPQFSKIPKGEYSSWIMFLAILTILPSMITLRGWELHKAAKMWKEVLLAVIYAYVIGPLLAYALSFWFPETSLRVGFFLANIVPLSSAALGYAMIARGNIELATVVLILLAFLTLPLVPLYMSFYSSLTSIHIPTRKVLYIVVVVLFLPMILGQIIRYITAKKKHLYYAEKEMKPYLSIITMLSLLALVFSLVLRKAPVIVRKPEFAVMIWTFQAIIAFATIFISIVVDKLLKISYENHQAIAIPSITKNQSIPAAIAISSIGGLAVLPPALIPAIQPVIVISYLHMENVIRKIFGSSEQ